MPKHIQIKFSIQCEYTHATHIPNKDILIMAVILPKEQWKTESQLDISSIIKQC